jgi:acyl-CoA dehydrogenase
VISVAAIVVALALIYAQMPWWAVGSISALVLLVSSQAGDMPWLAGGVWLSAAIGFGIGPVRRRVLSAPLMRWASKQLTELAQTEREALQAGDVGLEAELLSGRPQWPRYRDMQMVLSNEERAFIDGPVETVCAMVDDWHITHELADLPADVWHYLKTEGIFGLAIPSEYGGKGFSSVAQSEVLVKLYSASATLGVTVAVPNSLGPGELLHRYGTQAQKAYFLPRLVREDIPCFALTSPDAGSDASAILDEGVVCLRDFEGESVLGMELTFDKRYITLAPIATLIGLAFKLKDPDGLDCSEVGPKLG